jgi:hypothetical protein
MHSLLVSALLALPAAAQSCTSAFSQTDYGVLAAAGAPQAFCTNVPPSRYANNALQLSRHQAPPGHRLVLTITAWDTELDYDFAMVYTAAAGAAVAASAYCALAGASGTLVAKASGAGPPSFGPHFSGFGAQLGVCFYSDFAVTKWGVAYNLTAEACPAGSFCPPDASAPNPCPAGAFSAAGASSCTPCPSGTYSTAGASTCAFTAASCPAGTFASAPASCESCGAGTASAVVGATSGASCVACPAGTAAPAGASLCAICPAGSSAAAGAPTCNACAAGSFNSAAGASSCTSCAAGAYSAAGAVACAATCPAGMRTSAPASCFPCAAVRRAT